MIFTSEAWKEYTQKNNVYHIKGTLTNGGVTLNLTDADFMLGTPKISDSTSSTDTFDIGSVITNTFECTLNNFDGKFDNFNFDGATLTIFFGVIYEEDLEEWIQRGVYRTDKPTSLGSTIQIKAFDNMDRLNRFFIGVVVSYPISSSNLAKAICTKCGVAYDNDFWKIHDFSVNEFEYDESITCRAVLNWLCQINGGYARVNNVGKMEVKWYAWEPWTPSDALHGGLFAPWAAPDTADGGTIQPWAVVSDINGGEYGNDWIASQVKNMTVGIDNISITGVRAYAYNTVDEFQFSEYGNSGYIVKLENNPLINVDNMASIAQAVGEAVIGFKFQPFNASIYGDPSMEAGDSITIFDYRGKNYDSVITNFTFSFSGCDVSCGAETPSEKELEYTNPTTGVIQGATRAAYDYIAARKISADIITSGKLTGGTVGQNDYYYLGVGELKNATVCGQTRSDWRLIVGTNFGVTSSGTVYSQNGEFSGNLTATSGFIVRNGSTTLASFANISGGASLSFYNDYLKIDTLLGQYGTLQAPIAEIVATSNSSSYYPHLILAARQWASTSPLQTSRIEIDPNGIYGPVINSVQFITNGSEKLELNRTSHFATMASPNGSANIEGYYIYIDATGEIVLSNNKSSVRVGTSINCFAPQVTEVTSLGGSTRLWSEVFAKKGTINTSDRKEKDLLGEIEFAEDFIMGLKPIKYMWKNGDHRRTRMGFVAQDVAEMCKSMKKNLAVVTASYKTYGNEEGATVDYLGEDCPDEELNWGMYYDQIIAPMVKLIQDMNNRIKELERR